MGYWGHALSGSIAFPEQHDGWRGTALLQLPAALPPGAYTRTEKPIWKGCAPGFPAIKLQIKGNINVNVALLISISPVLDCLKAFPTMLTLITLMREKMI